MKQIKILSVIGTRPEAIKMAPCALEFERRKELNNIICLTGQHASLASAALSRFGLKPQYELGAVSDGMSLASLTAVLTERLGACMDEVKPELVLCQGDTVSAFAAALAAFYSGIPVAHVEAGLRSHDIMSPFPEEANRRMIASLATMHFAPTEESAENLRKEGVSGDVIVTGNTALDALRLGSGLTEFTSKELKALDLTPRTVVLTCHRRENYGKPMENIFSAVRYLAETEKDMQFVFPMHPAPAVRETAARLLSDTENVHLSEPVDAFDMQLLMRKCFFIMTDSGGIQEEAPSLGKPVLLLRRDTERPEAVRAGAVKLCGTRKEDIILEAQRLLHDSSAYSRMTGIQNPYGDGYASRRIADAIISKFA